jgi:hypothetical protein
VGHLPKVIYQPLPCLELAGLDAELSIFALMDPFRRSRVDGNVSTFWGWSSMLLSYQCDHYGRVKARPGEGRRCLDLLSHILLGLFMDSYCQCQPRIDHNQLPFPRRLLVQPCIGAGERLQGTCEGGGHRGAGQGHCGHLGQPQARSETD